MACFSVPASAAILTTIFRKKFPEEWHINWLNTMIWGGALALTIEHIAHGEIVPWPPFLTAMGNSQNFAMMLEELALVGLPMTIALVLAWAIMVVIYEKLIVPGKTSAVTGV